MIKGTCPACGRTFKVDDRYAGMTGRCKSCGATVTVPGEPDEGLEGLPGAPGGAAMAAAAPPPATVKRDEGRGTRDEKEGPAEAAGAVSSPVPRPPSPSSEPEPAPAPRVLEDPTLTHDVRSRYEPSHGPTAMEGAWLKGEPGREAADKTADVDGLHADDLLASRRIVTSVESGPGARRPAIILVACVVLGLLALGYAVLLSATGRVPGIALAAIGLGLAALGVVRLWCGYWDGLVIATLFCLCNILIVLLVVYTRTSEGGIVGFTRVALTLLGGAGVALALVVLAAVLPSSRAHLGSNR